MASLAASPAVQAAFPGENGRLLISRTSCQDSGCRDSTNKLSTFRANGTGFFSGFGSLATFGGFNDAAWSPDGRRVAITGPRPDDINGDEALQIYSAAAIVRRRFPPAELTLANTERARDPVWSPDASQLAFVESELLRAVTLGQEESSVLANRVTEPAWSSTGTLAYVRTRQGRPTVYTRPSTGAERPITATGGRSPDWSPDGRHLVYVKGVASPELWITRSNGTDPRRLTRDGTNPVWSPDGRWIAFLREVRANGQCEDGFGPCRTPAVYLIRPDGTGIRVVRRRKTPRSPGGSRIYPDSIEDWQAR
jgi:dipeptidyl aminopeptidase/acylaminoacyl peptidase